MTANGSEYNKTQFRAHLCALSTLTRKAHLCALQVSVDSVGRQSTVIIIGFIRRWTPLLRWLKQLLQLSAERSHTGRWQSRPQCKQFIHRRLTESECHGNAIQRYSNCNIAIWQVQQGINTTKTALLCQLTTTTAWYLVLMRLWRHDKCPIVIATFHQITEVRRQAVYIQGHYLWTLLPSCNQ